MIHQDTIVALATPSGAGAIAVIRMSGAQAIAIAGTVFQSVKGKDITRQKSHTLHLGHIVDGSKTLDEVLVSIFKGPNSYTGENTIEISCHGSIYIQQQIIKQGTIFILFFFFSSSNIFFFLSRQDTRSSAVMVHKRFVGWGAFLEKKDTSGVL